MGSAKVASKETSPERRFVLDSGAISHGANVAAGSCVTTPSVLDEFQPGGATRRRLDQLLAAGMTVAVPSAQSLKRVAAAVKTAGSASRLSPTDVDVLALAIDEGKHVVLLTDDYTVQDVARRLGVDVESISTKGVTSTKDWRGRCSGCGRSYDPARAGSSCDVCGHEIRAKPTGARRT